MTVINQKLKGEDPEETIYSSMMLKCFVTITSSQAKKILVGLESGGGSLSQKDIKKLTDYNSLRDMSQKELEKKSNDLERALKKFKKMQEELTGGSGNRDPSDYDDDDYYDEDDNFNSETPKNINLFGLIPRIIFGIFSVFNNYLSLFIVFIIVYFGLLMIRKINDSERKMKKKKKIEKYYIEEEEEFETEINEKLFNNLKKKKIGKKWKEKYN